MLSEEQGERQRGVVGGIVVRVLKSACIGSGFLLSKSSFNKLRKFPMTTSWLPHRRRRRDEATSAFTRADLLALLMLNGLLAVLTVKSLAGGRSCHDATACLNNHRRLALAWQMYADDNEGRLVGNLDGGGVMGIPNASRTWVLGWLDFLGRPDNTNTLFLTHYSPLAPYAGRVAEVFKCPSDLTLSRGSRGEPRVRSYSMNSYQNGRQWTTGFKVFARSSDFVSISPSSAFVFIEESEASVNDGYFVVDMTGYPSNPQLGSLVDYPAGYHNDGAVLSFADGHAEPKRWADRRTNLRNGLLVPLPLPSSNNPDIRWLQEHTTRRVITQ